MIIKVFERIWTGKCGKFGIFVNWENLKYNIIMEAKRNYEAPVAQVTDVELEATVLSGEQQNSSASRSGYGEAYEL